jgi:tellurite resistance protein
MTQNAPVSQHNPAQLSPLAQASLVATHALSRLISHSLGDAIFAFASGAHMDVMPELAKRRGESYVAALTQKPISTLTANFDAWIIELTRAIAPLAPPTFLPMADVLREGITMEASPKGLRSLFSSKPSEKDVQRVKRYGILATRVLRAVLAADGAIDAEELRTMQCFLGALAFSDADAGTLYGEAPIDVAKIEIFGEMEPAITKAILRGAWLAAAWDQIDPREEDVIRTVAARLGVAVPEVEAMRNEAVARVEARRAVGFAAIDAIRFMLSDRIPGYGTGVAVQVATLLLPRRYRDEGISNVEHWAPIQLGQRHKALSNEDKELVLRVSWCAALFEDPNLSRRALLRGRHDRIAQDLHADGAKLRPEIEDWLAAVLAPAAYPYSAGPTA